jgi:hypothetical protein
MLTAKFSSVTATGANLLFLIDTGTPATATSVLGDLFCKGPN